MLCKIEMQSGGADLEAAALRNKIIASKDTVKAKNNTYYVSMNGDDSNDGLSPERPIKTINHLSNLNICRLRF